MKNIFKAISFISIMSVTSGVLAATPRVSIKNTSASRIPSISGFIKSYTNYVTTGTITSSTLLDMSECIESYTSCMKGEDACGSNFEECTTNVLFHGKMPQCSSILYQCSSSGVNELFGTSDVSALGTVTSYKDRKTGKEYTGAVLTGISDYEVTKFTYPTANSEMQILIDGAAISNRLDKASCIKKYTNCLKKDSVCGSDFELCTSDTEFKKQSVACASTLARCDTEGVEELFGATDATNAPKSGSRIREAIDEGAALAALNAVNTCDKVVKQCVLSACGSNPTQCIVGSLEKAVNIAKKIKEQENSTSDTKVEISNTSNPITESDVMKYIKGKCLDTIGANKYCFMTYKEHTPTSKELADTETREDVFVEAYNDKLSALNVSLKELLEDFDTEAKDNCIETIKTCAMNSCGGGIGSVCYSQVYTNTSNTKTNNRSINAAGTYYQIQKGCEAVVDTDLYCQYAAESVKSSSDYSYSYTDNTTFETLFPKYKSTNTDNSADPISAVATLNALLSSSYSEAAIANMKKQCRNVAIGCVKSMCGTDYVNCYRNRTDIVSGTYDTGSAKFDKSMNKMGGVLDYNVVIGLCLNTVTNSSSCEEHLKIAVYNISTEDKESWAGYSSVSGAWKDANSTQTSLKNGEVATGNCTVSEENAKINTNCDTYTVADCGYVDEDGCVYDQEQTMSEEDYLLTNAGKSLFKSVLADIEDEVQAKYNAKLTKEQNVCYANNNGGIKGLSDHGSTFQWVKLKSSKIPKSYNIKGLTTKQFVESNDLYGSFCRARITLVSDDKDIQEILANKGLSTAYFAVGDAFTCGSWIDSDTLEKITDKVGEQAEKDAGKGGTKEAATYAWSTIAGLLGGGAVGTALTESGTISNLMNKANANNTASVKTNQQYKNSCVSNAEQALKYIDSGDIDLAKQYASTASGFCGKLGTAACINPSINKAAGETGYSDAAKDKFKIDVESLKSTCDLFDSDASTNASDKSIKAARIAIPIVTAAAGAALGAGISATVLQSKYETANNEAVKQWMEEIGEHIQCYVGNEELGSYGDVINFEIE